MRSFSCFANAFLILITASSYAQNSLPYSPGLSQWERLGPGGGGSTFIPTFSFANENTFMLKCDMTGSYLSNTGGESYQLINVPNGAGSYAFDPLDSAKIYIGASQLIRSTDAGKTWTTLFPKKNEIVAEHYDGDHGNYSIDVKPNVPYPEGDVNITSVFIDPAKNGAIYFSIKNWFYYSFNDGASFERIALDQPVQLIYSNKNLLSSQAYIFTTGKIHVFNKESKQISRLDIPSKMLPATCFAAGEIKGTGKVIFYALRDVTSKADQFAFGKNEVWMSQDMGKSWSQSKEEIFLNAPGDKSPSMAKIVCPLFDAAVAYVVANNIETKGADGKILHWYGALKTSNAGENWQWVWKGGGGSGQYRKLDANDAANLQDSWVTKAFGGEFIQLIDVGVSPQNGDVAIVTDWYRSMKTTDGGGNWKEVYSIDNKDGSYKSRGLDVTTCYSVYTDPFDTRHVAVSYTDIGLHHSFDNGHSWIRSVEGIPVEWNNTGYAMLFDPSVKNKIWSAWSGMHDIPRGKMTRNPDWKTSDITKGGIAISTDAGKTWKPVIKGMGDNSPATSIVMDPSSPVGKRTLYATVYNKGVFKSTDDGNSWELCNNGIDKNTAAFEISIATNGNLYLVICPVPEFANGERGRGILSGAVYKSTDGAASWEKLNITTSNIFFPSGLTIDAEDPNIIYLGCWGDISLGDLISRKVAVNTGGDQRVNMPAGIFMSKDGGNHWENIFDSTQYVYDVTVDPYHKGRLYCNTFNSAAYRSDDRGKHWKKLAGYDFHWGHRVIPDANDNSKVYITTYGSGVWHGKPEVAQ